MKLRYLYIIIITLIAVQEIYSQEMKLIHKYANNTLYLRWFIADDELWEQSLENGFNVLIENINLNTSESIQVVPDLLEYINGDPELDDLTYLSWLIHKDEIDDAQYDVILPVDEMSEEEILEARHLFADLDMNESFELINKAGFGYALRVNSSETYQINVEGNNLIASIEFNSKDYETPILPDLEPSWKNKSVDLKWNTKGSKEFFESYALLFSEDGENFIVKDSLLMNVAKPEDAEILHYIYTTVSLPDNENEYYIRLVGKDYFGSYSEHYSEIKGSGTTGIGFSPSITKSKQLRSNEVELEWDIPEEFRPNVTEWRIYVGETWEGMYLPDTMGIAPDIYELTRDIPFGTAYFRVVAVDKNNEEYSSFPKLVNSVDTIPPAIPTGISFSIDSLGLFTMTWNENNEKDFIGYKVFYGFDTIQDMTLSHPGYLQKPFYTDTIGLKSTNEYIYFKIISVDERNNRSDFSKILEVKKPDILPPVEPVFLNYKSLPGGTYLTWFPSPSSDVLSQKLYRRAISATDNWELISEWNVPNIDSLFQDSGLEAFEQYAYILIAEDDDGNVSVPSQPVVVTVLPDHSNVDVEAWNIRQDDDDRIIFFHEFRDDSIEEIRVYKSINDNQPFEIAILPITQAQFVDQAPGSNETITYFIRILFQDGTKSPYSQKKVIP